jgi:hypothetical protein
VGNPPSGVFGTLPLPRSSVLFHELASAVKRAQLTAGTPHVEAVFDGAGLRSEHPLRLALAEETRRAARLYGNPTCGEAPAGQHRMVLIARMRRGTHGTHQKGCRTCRLASRVPSSETTIASLCPYSTGSILAKAWHQGYQKARDEQRSPETSKLRGTNEP